ncbi:hypothetical protein Adeh_3186 [Anaeromyxobacter dehalogenans 2CP-C]|uniref:TolA protein n=1 Tax=Anaeromyxobacter dehalogenans (strain 2CP-C) TaxID=290397 RepID=Q2IEE7_ANADE|nr:hypothetical protein Adeh_3186 [Anaeromyxobacter dehalogenans 2CP-C]
MRAVSYAVACTALLLGCASRQQASESPNPATREVASAQAQSQEALKRAQAAQDAAAEQAKRAAAAETQVREDQAKLEQDQMKLRQEQLKAQQLQASAQQETARATQETQRHQRAAERGLVQQTERSVRGQQLAAGVVTQVRSDEIVLQPRAGDVMRFKLNDRTQVQIDGRVAAADQIREGAEARVVYEPSANGPTAVTVAVNPSGAASGAGMGSGDQTAPGTGSSTEGAPPHAPASPPPGTTK